MRYRRSPKPNDNPPQSKPQDKPQDATGFNPNETREVLFSLLEARYGALQAEFMQADFEKHVASDPVHGVEQGYLCLASTLIETIDLLNDITALGQAVEAESATEIPPASPFGMFRKDG